MDQAENDLAQTPGEILSVARQARSWSQTLVAEKLRVSVQIIKEIENDDYSHSTALIYTRGYLRMYARELGLSEDLVLQSFEQLNIAMQTAEAVSFQSSPVLDAPSMIKHRFFRWISWFIGFVLMVLVFMWWHGQRSSDTALMPPTHVKASALPLAVPRTTQSTQNLVNKAAPAAKNKNNQLTSGHLGHHVTGVKKS